MNPSPEDKHDDERKRKADDGSWMHSPEEKTSPTGKGDSNGNGRSVRGGSGRRRLKPLFEVGAAVTAAWWPDPLSRRNDVPSSWLPGVVRSYRCIAAAGPYGPTRSYVIEYGDGDELDDVAEHLVFTKEDYDLTMQNDGKSDWVGVRNVVDHAANDLWAQIAGWYIATIDGEERPFSLLANAMDAYDASVVAKRKSKEIKPSDLNRPEKYARLFEQNSPSEGGGSKAEGHSERKKKKKKKRKRKSSSKNSQPDPKRAQLQADGTPPSVNHQVITTEGNSRPANQRYKKFSDRVVELKAYKEKHGHFHFGPKDKYSSCLAAFAHQCRHARRSPKTAPMTLSDRHIGMLDDIGFDWLTESNNAAKPTNSAISVSTTAAATSTATSAATSAATSKESSKLIRSANKKREISTVSAYIGVSFCKRHQKYLAQKQSDYGTLHCLGYYKIEADAALAVDKGSMLRAEKEFNFTTRNSYEKHIRVEMQAASHPVDAKERYDAVVEEVGLHLSQIYAEGNKEVTDAKLANNNKAGEGADAAVGKAENNSGGAVSSDTGQNNKSSGLVSPERKKKLTSDYVGVSYASKANKWKSQIWYDKSTINLSSYALETDAAMAYDEAARLLKKPQKANFAMLQDYKDAQLHELQRSGSGNGGGMSSLAIVYKMAEVISRAVPSLANSISENRGDQGRKEPKNIISSIVTSKTSGSRITATTDATGQDQQPSFARDPWQRENCAKPTIYQLNTQV